MCTVQLKLVGLNGTNYSPLCWRDPVAIYAVCFYTHCCGIHSECLTQSNYFLDHFRAQSLHTVIIFSADIKIFRAFLLNTCSFLVLLDFRIRTDSVTQPLKKVENRAMHEEDNAASCYFSFLKKNSSGNILECTLQPVLRIAVTFRSLVMFQGNNQKKMTLTQLLRTATENICIKITKYLGIFVSLISAVVFLSKFHNLPLLPYPLESSSLFCHRTTYCCVISRNTWLCECISGNLKSNFCANTSWD